MNVLDVVNVIETAIEEERPIEESLNQEEVEFLLSEAEHARHLRRTLERIKTYTNHPSPEEAKGRIKHLANEALGGNYND